MDEPKLNRVYLTLGSNVDPKRNLTAAVTALARHGRIAAVSRVWETPPADGSSQPAYLNGAVLLETSMKAHELYPGTIRQIEHALNRVRDPNDRNAPRTIDIDMAFFNREILKIEHRHIPDPEVVARVFLAVPLADVDGGFVHPQCGRSLERIADTLRASSPVVTLRRDIILSRALPAVFDF